MGKYLTGWMTPTGNFIECQTYCHFSAILKHEELSAALEGWGETKRLELIRIYQGCQDLVNRGEHPEWHCYEMAEDDIKYEARIKLLRKGFLRVGTKGNTLYFEGKSHGIKKLFQTAKDFAENHGMDYEFEKVK
jgi:hypothetical protein